MTGGIAAQIQSVDWSRTPLGATDSWSDALRFTLRIILASPRPMQLLWGPDLVQIPNDAYVAGLGPEGSPALGASARQCHPAVWEQVGDQIERVWRGGGPVWETRILVPVTRNGRLSEAWWNYSYSAIDSDAGIEGVLVICEEVTEQVLAERRVHLLMQEMNHRVKNSLATVQSLVMLSAAGAKSVQEFASSLGERISAMARAQDILLRGHEEDVAVGDLIAAEIEPYAGSHQLRVQSAPVMINPRHAVSLGLMLHELLTNAAKYGGLSTPGGRLVVTCRPTENGGAVDWKERTERPLSAPHARGFGTFLIEHLARELGGEARLTFDPHGLEAMISFRGTIASQRPEPTG